MELATAVLVTIHARADDTPERAQVVRILAQQRAAGAVAARNARQRAQSGDGLDEPAS